MAKSDQRTDASVCPLHTVLRTYGVKASFIRHHWEYISEVEDELADPIKYCKPKIKMYNVSANYNTASTSTVRKHTYRKQDELSYTQPIGFL